MSSHGKTSLGQFRDLVERGFLSPAEVSSIKASRPEMELVNIDGNVVKAKHAGTGRWAVLTDELENLLDQIGF